MANVRKLSAKTIIGEVKKMVRSGKIKSGQEVARVIGLVNGIRRGQTTYGDYVALSGDFEAVNLMTGVTMAAPEFFPDYKTANTLAQAVEKHGEIEIALSISIDVSDDYPMGFAYVTRPIMQNASDRLGALRKRMAALESKPADAAPESKPDDAT